MELLAIRRTIMDLNDVLTIVNRPDAVNLCLSKGGWEGWLQCELWRYLTFVRDESVEREIAYPNTSNRCDLVVSPSRSVQMWVEIKAYGLFRQGDENNFLDSIAADLYKLDNYKPKNTSGLMLVVVPAAIAASFNVAISRWAGVSISQGQYVSIFYWQF